MAGRLSAVTIILAPPPPHLLPPLPTPLPTAIAVSRWHAVGALSCSLQAALRRRLAVVHLKVMKEFSQVSLENLQTSLEACKAELTAAQKAKVGCLLRVSLALSEGRMPNPDSYQ